MKYHVFALSCAAYLSGKMPCVRVTPSLPKVADVQRNCERLGISIVTAVKGWVEVHFLSSVLSDAIDDLLRQQSHVNSPRRRRDASSKGLQVRRRRRGGGVRRRVLGTRLLRPCHVRRAVFRLKP